MPNLINTDSAGNTFYNYITPVITGESGAPLANNALSSLFTEAYGPIGTNWNIEGGNSTKYKIRFPAPGLETRSGDVTTLSSGNGYGAEYYNIRARLDLGSSYHTLYAITNTGNQNNSVSWNAGGQTSAGYSNASYVYFFVLNDYSFQYCIFTSSALTTLYHWGYSGWLREPIYTSSTIFPLGYVQIHKRQGQYLRTSAVGVTTTTALSSAADSITSPPIVCTPGTDPGDGSETATDIVIRDADLPNNPVGKLWNCIDLPDSCTVGKLYKNTGNYDGDDTASEQDVYLCVMPWGTRKLGMRVWTEESV